MTLSLQDYLQNAPKTVQTAFHRKFVHSTGILNNTRIISDICNALQGDPRWLELLPLDSWKHHMVCLIYASGNRGLTNAEILSTIPKDHRTEVQSLLQVLCEELVLYRSSGSTVSYYGFVDLKAHFELSWSIHNDEKTVPFQSHQQIHWHLAICLKSILLGEIQLTNTHELHRRSQKQLEDQLSLRNSLGTIEERQLLLQFAADQNWIQVNQQTLILADSAWGQFAKPTERIRNRILGWWANLRMRSSLEQFRTQLGKLPPILSVTDLITHFWPLLPDISYPDYESSYRFESLPRIIKEMWLLHFIELDFEKNRCQFATLSSSCKQWIQSGIWTDALELKAHCTPNFEIFIPQNAPLNHLIALASFAEPRTDDTLICMNLQKERFLNALRSSLPTQVITETLESLKLPSIVQHACQEWRHIHEGSWIEDRTVLRIHNPSIWNELAQFPLFLEHTEDVIPNWGFLLKKSHILAVRDLLSQFGLEPPQAPQNISISELGCQWNKEFEANPQFTGAIDYTLEDPAASQTLTSTMLGTGLYSKEFQKLDNAQLLKILRYALVMEADLEAILGEIGKPSTEQSVRFRVQRINQRRDPYRIIAWDSKQTALEFGLDQILQIRLV